MRLFTGAESALIPGLNGAVQSESRIGDSFWQVLCRTMPYIIMPHFVAGFVQKLLIEVENSLRIDHLPQFRWIRLRERVFFQPMSFIVF